MRKVKAFNIKELTGCKKVYAFTLRTIIFNKANLISAAILIFFSVISPILLSLFSQSIFSDIGSSGHSAIQKDDGIQGVFIDNQTEYTFNIAPFVEGATVSDYKKTEEEFIKNENGVLYVISFDTESYTYKIRAVFSDTFDGSRDKASDFAYTVADVFDAARYGKLQISTDQITEVFSPSSVNVTTAESYFKTENDRTFMAKFAVQYLFAIVVLILVAFSATYIIRAVLEEKSSKLVETLLVSVRPLALITGKILAVMTYIFGLLFTVIGCAVLSNTVTSSITQKPFSFSSVGIDLSGIRFDAPTLILIIISLLISYVTFSVMAGVAGAACSSMDELESANSSVMFTVLIGYLVSCATCAVPGSTVATVTSLLPLVSTFSAPAHYILGNISVTVFLISLAFQILVAVLLTVFCSRVYAELIMKKGNRIRLKDIFKTYLSKKRGN